MVDSVAYDWRPRAFRAGDLWVPLDQPSGLAAVHLLEVRAPDGLMYWNAFDTVLMRKEYAEGYVIDPIARRMLQARPALADSFRALIAHDSTFAHDPAARASWIFSSVLLACVKPSFRLTASVALVPVAVFFLRHGWLWQKIELAGAAVSAALLLSLPQHLFMREDNVRETSFALYFENQTQWNHWLRTIAGVRGDRYHVNVAGNIPENSGGKTAGIVRHDARAI